MSTGHVGVVILDICRSSWTLVGLSARNCLNSGVPVSQWRKEVARSERNEGGAGENPEREAWEGGRWGG